MLVRIEEFLLNRPEWIIGLGRALAYFGWVLIMFALLGNVAKVATGTLLGLAGRASATKTLADIYPSLPTWWIPESIVGALPAIFMVITGLIILQFGRQLKRILGRI